jgi:hypothetical protein
MTALGRTQCSRLVEYSCTVLGDYAIIYSGEFVRKVHISYVILTPGGDDSLVTTYCKKLGGILFERFIDPTLTLSNQEEGIMVYTQMGTCVEWKNPVWFSKAGDSKLDFSMTK